MANCCDTTYRIIGPCDLITEFWNKLQNLGVNNKDVWLGDVAKAFGIDYEKEQIHVRGMLYWAELDTDSVEDGYLLSFDTDTAWGACTELFERINEILNWRLSINYREVESGCEIFCVHDEKGFFPEECCVSCEGELFGDFYEELFDTIEDAIEEWCSKMNIDRGDRSEREMLDFIETYEYEDEDVYFYIHPFDFV